MSDWQEIERMVAAHEERKQNEQRDLTPTGCKLKITYGGSMCHKVAEACGYCPRHALMVSMWGLAGAEDYELQGAEADYDA